jgi:hypothetical protein
MNPNEAVDLIESHGANNSNYGALMGVTDQAAEATEICIKLDQQ